MVAMAMQCQFAMRRCVINERIEQRQRQQYRTWQLFSTSSLLKLVKQATTALTSSRGPRTVTVLDCFDASGNVIWTWTKRSPQLSSDHYKLDNPSINPSIRPVNQFTNHSTKQSFPHLIILVSNLANFLPFGSNHSSMEPMFDVNLFGNFILHGSYHFLQKGGKKE